MPTKTVTSRDAKQAREALMKQLAELPLSGRARSKAQTLQRKSAQAEPPKTAVKA